VALNINKSLFPLADCTAQTTYPWTHRASRRNSTCKFVPWSGRHKSFNTNEYDIHIP